MIQKMERKNTHTMNKNNRDRQQQRYRGGRATTDLGEQQRDNEVPLVGRFI